MGCGCKGKKKKNNPVLEAKANTEEEALQRKRMITEQRDYQDKVRDALQQLSNLRGKKQRSKR